MATFEVLLAYGALGFGFGAGSSILPGPCGLAVLDAALRRGLPRALATSAGSALGDVTYASLGILGIGRLLAQHPDAIALLQALGGVALVAFGLASVSRRPPARATAGTLGGFVVGYLTLLANPGAFVTWVLVVGGQLLAAPIAAQWCTVIGIGAGTFCWYSATAFLAIRGSRLLASPHVPTFCGTLLVSFGVASLARVIARVV
jgi:L-lysine exporter family protein LysE/ArgO